MMRTEKDQPIGYFSLKIPYDWVPEDTPRSENPVKKLDVTEFRITE